MTKISEIICATSVMLGSIIGAGFLSGKELTGFFGLEGYPFFLFCAAILFVFCYFAIFRSIKNGNKIINSKFVKISSLISDFVFSVGCVGGINYIQKVFLKSVGCFGGGFSLPILSALTFVLAEPMIKKISVIEKINACLLPICLIVVNAIAIKSGASFNIFAATRLKKDGFSYIVKIIKAFLYVFTNVFAAVPVLTALTDNKTEKSLKISSMIFGALFFLQAFVILSAISVNPQSICDDMPVLVLVKNGAMGVVFLLVMYIGIFTSLCSFCYPVFKITKNDKSIKAAAVIFILALSMMGVSAIIKYLYPIVGVIGGVVFIKIIKNGIKKR